MIIPILFVLFIVWVWWRQYDGHKQLTVKIDKDKEILQEIRNILTFLLKDTEDEINVKELMEDLELEVDKDHTFLEDKRIMHLVLKNIQTNYYFDDQTLIRVAIHEFSHYICPELGHTPLFDQIESHYIQTAIKLGFLETNSVIDSSYPCIDD